MLYIFIIISNVKDTTNLTIGLQIAILLITKSDINIY